MTVSQILYGNANESEQQRSLISYSAVLLLIETQSACKSLYSKPLHTYHLDQGLKNGPFGRPILLHSHNGFFLKGMIQEKAK